MDKKSGRMNVSTWFCHSNCKIWSKCKVKNLYLLRFLPSNKLKAVQLFHRENRLTMCPVLPNILREILTRSAKKSL